MLFDVTKPEKSYQAFRAKDFDEQVCGFIHRETVNPAVCGVPLGGVDTGCIDLETSGMWGYNTIFNSLIPRGGPLNAPALGLSVDGYKVVLSTLRPKQNWMKSGVMDGNDDPQGLSKDSMEIPGVAKPAEIIYWGHYPICDLDFEIDLPITASARFWAPFIPGDIKISSAPFLITQLFIGNRSEVERSCTAVFNFPGPSKEESGTGSCRRKKIDDVLSAVEIRTENLAYVVGAIDAKNVRTGDCLGTENCCWASFDHDMPVASPDSTGVSLATDFTLAPAENKIITFVMSWHCPVWKGSGNPKTELHITTWFSGIGLHPGARRFLSNFMSR